MLKFLFFNIFFTNLLPHVKHKGWLLMCPRGEKNWWISCLRLWYEELDHFFLITKPQKTKTESSKKEKKHLSVKMYLVPINPHWCSRWKKDEQQKERFLKGGRGKPNSVIGAKQRPTLWAVNKHTLWFHGWRNDLHFLLKGWVTRCERLARTQLNCVCRFQNGWIVFTCPVRVNTYPVEIAVYWRCICLNSLIL